MNSEPRFTKTALLQEHRALVAISIPMILSNITVPLLGLVDTAVIGHLPEAYFLGGTAVGSMLITMVVWLAGFLRMTTTGLSAQAYGAASHTALVLVLWRGVVIALALASLLLLFQGPLISMGLSLSGGSEAVQFYAHQYVTIRVWGFPAALLNLVILGWLLGMHQARSVMWLLVLTNAMNIVLDVWFVPVLGWQVQGVALATLLSEYAGLALGIWLVIRVGKNQKIAFAPPWQQVFYGEALGRYLRLNRDVLIRTLCLEIAFAFMTFQGARLGDIVVAANAILMGFLLLISFGLDGVAFGAEVRVGRAKGALDAAAVRLATTVALLWTAILAGLYSLFFLLRGDWLIGVMSTVPEVNRYAHDFLPWMVLLPVVACWCYLYDGVYIGLTRANVMRNSMLVATFGVFFPAWFLFQGLGNQGLWIAFTLFMASRGLTLGWHFHRMTPEKLLQ